MYVYRGLPVAMSPAGELINVKPQLLADLRIYLSIYLSVYLYDCTRSAREHVVTQPTYALIQCIKLLTHLHTSMKGCDERTGPHSNIHLHSAKHDVVNAQRG